MQKHQKNTSTVLLYKIIIENRMLKKEKNVNCNIIIHRQSIQKLKEIHKQLMCPGNPKNYGIYYMYYD